MPDTPTVHIRHNGDEERTRIRFANGDTEYFHVTPLGDDLYRLRGSSLLGAASYGDVIRAINRGDGSLLFVQVQTLSILVTQTWLLTAQTIESPELRRVLDDVMTMAVVAQFEVD